MTKHLIHFVGFKGDEIERLREELNEALEKLSKVKEKA